MPFTAAFTPVRIMCNNTLNMALRDCESRITIRHILFCFLSIDIPFASEFYSFYRYLHRLYKPHEAYLRKHETMTYGLILLFLLLVWKWRLRDLIKRLLILASLPVLHVHFLKKAENPLVFQAWTLAVILVLAILGTLRMVRWLRSFRA